MTDGKKRKPGRPARREPDSPPPAPRPGQVDPAVEIPPRRIAELIERIRESADKLVKDKTSRGDLKILSRTLRELRYAFKVFTPYRHLRKVTVFGSARTPPERPAYAQAVAFGRAMAEHEWLIVTGAASGIMEAGHVGAGREHSMGLNILLPFEQAANRVIAGDPKLVHMKYFFTRKLMFVKESDAICLLPGGFGTLDEGLEVLTLLQTGKRDMVPVVFLDEPGGNYWSGFQQFIRRHLLDGGMIDADDLGLYRITDRVDEAVEEILGFFRVYHSMRYVRGKLVLRLHQAPRRGLLAQINSAVRRHCGGGANHRRRPVAGREGRARPDRHAAVDLPVQPPQLRSLAAVDRLFERKREEGREKRDLGI